MANVKITELTAATALAGTDVLPIVDVGADATKKVSVSDLLRNLPDGSAASPSLAFADDQNTGVLSPGNNSLAFATSGTQRLVIDSSGRVGVGTSSPAHNLDISPSSGAAELKISGAEGQEASIRLFADQGDDAADIKRFLTDTSGNLKIQHYSGSAYVDSMVIDSTGNVLVGTTDSTIYNNGDSDSEGIVLRDGEVVDIARKGDLQLTLNRQTNDGHHIGFFRSGSPKSYIATRSDGFCIDVNGFERFRINSSGRLLVGTTTTSVHGDRLIEVGSTSRSATYQAITTSTSGTGGIVFADTTTNDTGGYRGIIQYAHSNDSLQFSTAATERLRIDSSGNVGIGVTAPSAKLDVNGSVQFGDGGGFDMNINGTRHQFSIGGTERMRIDSSGNVGIGTTSPNFKLDVNGEVGITEGQRLSWHDGSGGRSASIFGGSGDVLAFTTTSSNTERMRIDSSGRLLLGTTAARTDFFSGSLDADIQVEGSSYAAYSCYATNGNGAFIFGRDNGASGSTIGNLSWQADDGTDEVEAARISGQIDGTPGSNDMPGRLVFSTTADGASSPTERMRIKSNGDVSCGAAAHLDGFSISSSSATGSRFASSGTAVHFASGTSALVLSRQTNDGIIVSLRQAGSEEGSITVSGSTVSYNGGHLSRWSQLTGGAERIEILRGSVLSNLDEMCEWGDEDNEQLNRMRVSDIEAWDDDDDTYTNDFYCAMTGDFVIRIAQGTTVARGDLLMSAGDGTAKPQDDDIVRSKTIAKVTSTTVSTTYADGSYCVPCVLMAC